MFDGRPPREGAWPPLSTSPSRPSSATSWPSFDLDTPRNSLRCVMGSGPRSRRSASTSVGLSPLLELTLSEPRGLSPLDVQTSAETVHRRRALTPTAARLLIFKERSP